MRIGVDASTWSNARGYGRFTRELVPEMIRGATEDEFVLFADAATLASIETAHSNARMAPVEQSTPAALAASAQGNRSPRDMLRMSAAVRRARLDVFFSPSVYTYFPLPLGLPAVVTIHDAIAERFPELTLPSWRARLFWNAKVRLARLQARLILTVSDYSARQLASVLGIPRSRIRVVSEAPAAAYRPSDSPTRIENTARHAGLPPGAQWFTYVGGFNPHKHVELLIEAHGRLASEHPGAAPYLVLVGSPERDVFHSGADALHSAVERAGTKALVLWAGYVPDEELADLHSGALALALPSASEGFGLPAVEAAACGTPVIATTESPLPDLLAGGGLFVPPGNVDALAEAMRQLLQDAPTRQAMGRVALEQAAKLNWGDSARSALAAVREVAQ
jgi:glycosyltransferase involved in cell wall biosynthesis